MFVEGWMRVSKWTWLDTIPISRRLPRSCRTIIGR